ncbi:UNVERIFIED_CONTAM: NEDD8-specific protease 1 [Sesamum angustifolium]|uniref:NEDD8-specific protease 1 n=1 Tax=Sesamum angustifolium TaxID=2727405 RepID=A0AAW2QQ46_9LAMI
MAEGGSHWSLLAFERNANVFVHHDSSGGINSAHAKRVYRAVISYTASDAKYVECSSTPRQENGYDCGLYVAAIARVICEWYQNDGPKGTDDLWFAAIKEQITPSHVSKMRNDILELVRSLMSKQ